MTVTRLFTDRWPSTTLTGKTTPKSWGEISEKLHAACVRRAP
ncbi:hypothetical protein [Jannaschia sp. R86511]